VGEAHEKGQLTLPELLSKIDDPWLREACRQQ
jgi:hypothetical protein